MVHALKPEMHRLASLELVIPLTRMSHLLRLLEGVGAPALEHLSLHLPLGRRIIDLEQALRLRFLFGAYTPRLRTLDLNAVSLPWTNSIYRSLTHLHIYRQHPTCTPNQTTFCAVLMACPDLQSLHLSEAGVFPPQFDAEPVQPVELLSLQILYLANRPSQLYTIMSCIRCIHTVVVHLECETDSRDMPIRMIVPPTFQFDNVISLFVTSELSSQVEVLCKTENNRIFTLFLNTKLGIMISAWPYVIGLICIWPTDNLRSLELRNCSQDIGSTDRWKFLLYRLPHLQELTVEENAVEKYADVLQALQSMGVNEDGEQVVLCPALQHLILSSVLRESLEETLNAESMHIRCQFGAPRLKISIRPPST